MRRPSTDTVFSLGFEALAKLKPARDLAYLRRSIPDLAQYRLAHHVIKAWAKERGIYGARFGYLGGIHISVLLVSVCKAMAMEADTAENGKVSAEDIVTTFFDHFADYPWHTSAVFDSFFHRALTYRRTSREPMCLLGWHPPSLNTASAASSSTTRTLRNEMERARALLSTPGMTWPSFIGRDHASNSLPCGASDFLNGHKSYARLDIHYWGSSSQGGARLLGWIESRCANILIGTYILAPATFKPALMHHGIAVLTCSDLGSRVGSLTTRFWPQRFAEVSQHEQEGVVDAYEGFYLIGLAWDENEIIDEMHTTTEPVPALSNVRAILQQLERRITSDEEYFDPRTSWFNASVIQAAQLGPISIDNRDWGRLVEDDDSDDEDDEPAEEFINGLTSPVTMENPATRPAPQGDDDGQQLGLVAHEHTGSATPKLRTAIDVLNRLLWDPELDADDHNVGYIDRFDGIQEKVATSWKTEQTDEEFIPQHRIAYFRRKSTGTVVWDRARRIDLIFRHS